MKYFLSDRVLLLDGATGTMIQRLKLKEEDYKGSRFRDIPFELKGCHDILSLTRPDIIGDIHRQYLRAGADIITTNSFNANAISLGDYELGHLAYEIARESARIAREAADEFTAVDPARPRLVAGTMGPTNKSASMSSDIMNPAMRDITFGQLAEAYMTQAQGLLDGGVDILLIETVFDTLNAKAAIYAIEKLRDMRHKEIPVMISATVSDGGGRILSGQTLDAFYASVAHVNPLTVGLNCAFGPEQMLPHLRRLSEIAQCGVSCHPNAGLPNVMGEYDETPESFARIIKTMLDEGLLNIVGGCCGTTPEHIAEIAEFIDQYKPREIGKHSRKLTVSNLEPLTISRQSNFINVGERTNVAGSAKFARLIREGNYEEAVSIARKQIENGAQIIDVCMDAPMIDGADSMRTFLNLLASEPDIARVPVMIDSSDWHVIQTGLQVCQGKCIVNSISLKEGESAFLDKAKEIRRYGAAVVVMLFDEEGQADTLERKIQVARRSYDLLVEAGFPAEDIIFDPNILTVATGIKEHDRYALDFINAVRWIKENLPHVKVSGGVSNLSFAFRGNNYIREAMHSAFLYHAIKAGMDMAIVNAGMLKVYSEIEPELLDRIEDVLLVRRDDATERLLDYASGINKAGAEEAAVPQDVKESSDPGSRIRSKLMKGISDGLEVDLKEVMSGGLSAMEIIEKMLMPVMGEIGDLFGAGKMFLPQVIKSARVLKQSISILAPSIEESGCLRNKGKIIIATVRGDIHDIGKNIVGLVAGCGGFDVIDLGVMADAVKIADETEKISPVAVLLSGLISPSLHEMEEVCREFERRGLKVPVIVGGATTSPLHTALKIAPVYGGPVIHSSDASANSKILSKLASAERDTFIKEIRNAQFKLRDDYHKSSANSAAPLSLEEARERKMFTPDSPSEFIWTEKFVSDDYDIAQVEPYINWDALLSSWDIKVRKNPEREGKKSDEIGKILEDAGKMLDKIKNEKLLTLQCVAEVVEATPENEDIVLATSKGKVRLTMSRNRKASGNGECVADFLCPEGDRVCLFALTAGVGLSSWMEKLRSEGNDYDAIMAKLVADRLAEAFAVKITDDFLGSPEAGCRMAFGYPAIPDHNLKRDVFEILDVDNLTMMRLNEKAMIIPEESICGILFRQGEYFAISDI